MTPDEINGLVERLTGAGSEGIDAIDRLRLYATDSDVFRIDFEDAAELTELVEAVTDAIAQQRDQLAAANSRITELTAEIERLREVARPLADAAEAFDRMPIHDPEQWSLWSSSSNHPNYPSRQITVGDARRARAALSHQEGK